MPRVHAVADDALADHDAVALRELLTRRQVGPAELRAAAVARAEAVGTDLGAVAHAAWSAPRLGDPDAPLAGIPSFVKDNTDVAGMPSNHGSEAFVARPARRDSVVTRLLLGTGLTALGKSTLPEFGFNASTEFMTGPPARNPWDPTRSVGASSGGAAALVAAGVVPVAHANDGGGSIRIPAAAAGLVGLKPSRGRHVAGEQARMMPIDIVAEGVVTRTVRDTAAFLAAAERHRPARGLPPVGDVRGPSDRRLRIGFVLDSVIGESDAVTRAAVEDVATTLADLGHHVEPAPLPVGPGFVDDFTLYWAFLAEAVLDTARVGLDRRFDVHRADGLSRGLRSHWRRHATGLPGALRRLRAVPGQVDQLLTRYDVGLSPVTASVTPPLGHLSPTVAFPTLLDRLQHHVGFTPLDNVAGTPAISLPLGATPDGLPVGVQLNTGRGGERTLLELAFALEQARPFRSIVRG